jgi:GT2 family glycosyltransferase
MTVAVLIVNWNGGRLLNNCLKSLADQRRPPEHVVVVDNNSTDDSLDVAAERLRAAELIRLTSNVGFAKANNIAARAARGFDAMALLNPDAVADPGWLEALVRAAELEPRAASFASQMRLANSSELLDGAGDSYHVSGRAWRNGHRQRWREWPKDNVEVFAPCAAAALYRRDAFEEVGGFDETYFCYFEDVDLGFRLRLKGYRSLYVSAAIVSHVSSASSGYRSDFAVYHGERNAVWTFVKDMPGLLFWMYLPQHVALNLAALVYYPRRGQGRVVLRAKLDALRGLPSMIKRRWAIQHNRRVDSWTLRRAMLRGIGVPYLARYSSPLSPHV